LNLGLHKKEWLAADAYTIADMCCYPWAAGWEARGIDIEEFPHVKRWLGAVVARPAVQKAMEDGKQYIEDPATLSEAEKARRAGAMVNQRATPVPAAWG